MDFPYISGENIPNAPLPNSPAYYDFIRKLAMEQSIRQMSDNARANANQPQAPNLPMLPVPPQPQPVAPPVAGPAPAAPIPVQPQPMAMPQNPTPAPQPPAMPALMPPQPQAQNPQQPPMQGVDPMASGMPIPGMKGPPVDEADAARRKQGWVDFVNRVKTDPNMQLALIRFGTQILQPIQPGQNQVGHLAGAIQGSIDYAALNKQRLAELGKTEAGTGLTQAQTTTEQAQPERVGAETKRIEATTARIEKMTPKEEALADAQIDKLKKDLGLTDAQIASLGAETSLKDDPRYKEAVIKLMEAKAWHEKNPAAVGSAQLKARQEFVKWMAPVIMRSDPELSGLAQTDPQAAQDQAMLKANDLWFSTGVQQRNIDDQAQAQYELLKRQWQQNPGGMSFDQYINSWAGDIMQPSQNRPLINAVVKYHDAQSGVESPTGLNTDPSKTRPPLSSFEK